METFISDKSRFALESGAKIRCFRRQRKCFSLNRNRLSPKLCRDFPILVLWGLLAVQTASGQAFTVDTISNAVFQRMQGGSFPEECTIRRTDLRYLRVLHYDAEGKVHEGELVCNKMIAQDLIEIFRELYKAHYPIARMQLIDDFGADDEESMQANNTSCFCFRQISGSRKLSKHAQGLAIDINPLFNPYVRQQRGGRTVVQPKTARRWANRKATSPYKIEKGDLCHRLFLAHGFSWGGAWRSLKDYQHFEK